MRGRSVLVAVRCRRRPGCSLWVVPVEKGKGGGLGGGGRSSCAIIQGLRFIIWSVDPFSGTICDDLRRVFWCPQLSYLSICFDKSSDWWNLPAGASWGRVSFGVCLKAVSCWRPRAKFFFLFFHAAGGRVVYCTLRIYTWYLVPTVVPDI